MKTAPVAETGNRETPIRGFSPVCSPGVSSLLGKPGLNRGLIPGLLLNLKHKSGSVFSGQIPGLLPGLLEPERAKMLVAEIDRLIEAVGVQHVD